jgi:L-aminopeptidase/D-esterase-like protein
LNYSGSITDVEGVKVGHRSNLEAATGCTVVLFEDGAVGGVDVRGPSPGTREIDLLRPTYNVNVVHAVLLSGGSAFGLDAAGGVVRYLEEHGIGYQAGDVKVPIVPAAILYDLRMITNKIRPGADDGYAACVNATAEPVAEGTVGAGTGATVGKVMGYDRGVKGGIGTSSVHLGDGLMVGAITAVNAIGGVYDHRTGGVVAGPRDPDSGLMQDSLALMTSPDFKKSVIDQGTNTTIGVVATNARLTKEQANRLASSSHDGLALAVRPAHLMGDGDVLFGIATGKHGPDVELNRILAAAAVCVSDAIVKAIRSATGLGGVPSITELSLNG